MAIVVRVFWKDMKADQYDAVLKAVDWEGNAPQGLLMHVASFDESGMHITDVWDKEESLQQFQQSRLMPQVGALGIGGLPEFAVEPLHRAFNALPPGSTSLS